MNRYLREINLGTRAGVTVRRWTEAPPIGTSQGLFHLTETMPAYAGSYLHRWDSPVHTHSFVEIAFAVSGAAVHHSLAGRREMRPGEVLLLRPGVWHGYEDCQRFEVYNCCFSSELLRRELAWTREDPLLGFLLWAGPYSSPGRGVLDDQPPAVRPSPSAWCISTRWPRCGTGRPRCTGPISSAACRSCSASSARPSSRTVARHPGNQERRIPRSCGRCALLEADLARDWTLTGLAAELHLAPGYLVRLFNAATGLPPMAYLAQLRAEHAAVMLLHTDEPVTSIGRTVGWPDQSKFARRFKAHYGLSATTYRKRFATRSVHLHHSADPVAAAS